MAVHMISYDLRHPGRNYQSLYDAIMSYGSYAHVNESVWAIATQYSSAQVRDHLLQHIDENDALIVARLAGEAAWWGLPEHAAAWLNKNLPYAQ